MRLRSILFVAILSLSVTACGWHNPCTRYTSYELNEEMIVGVGSPMVQTGCFASRWDPAGLNRVLLKRSSMRDYSFEPWLDNELIYSGRQGDVLHIQYREYATYWTRDGQKNIARTPFFQQAFYDLKTSDSVAFKGWLLQVTDANNQNIRFKVLQGPSFPEIPPPVKDGE